MSNRQAVILASRVVCVFFLYCAFANLTHFPNYIFDMVHHWHALSIGLTPAYDKYWLRYESLELEAALVRVALEIFFAGIFYRCGADVSRFLLGAGGESPKVEAIP